MKVWMCMNCGYIYRQERGDPEAGIPAGTSWDDIPDEWRCPDCNAAKADFDMVEL